MFRIQNQSDGKEQEFQNLAALLYALEGEEKRCLQLNMRATFYLFHLDKNEEVLESMELTIPAQEDKEVQELIGEFGRKGRLRSHSGNVPNQNNNHKLLIVQIPMTPNLKRASPS